MIHTHLTLSSLSLSSSSDIFLLSLIKNQLLKRISRVPKELNFCAYKAFLLFPRFTHSSLPLLSTSYVYLCLPSDTGDIVVTQ